MDDREDSPDCEVCSGEMKLIFSICGGFKVTGEGAHSSRFQARTGKGRYLFDKPVGPLDKRSRAYQKQQDDAHSTHYGPGQSCSMSNSEFKAYSDKRDGLNRGQTRFK
jgi:hypothetical protein